MNIFRYLDWQMYKDARVLNNKIGSLSKELSYDTKRKYGDQWNRAALSVCLNIAEAAGRYSDADMCRHFDIALGSIAEVLACADNLLSGNHLSDEQFADIYSQVGNIAKQIQGMKYNTYKNPRIIKKEFGYIPKPK